MELVFLVLAIAAGAFFFWYSWERKRRRREALLGFAATNGLQFSPDDPFGLLGYGFRLLSKGDGRGVENVVYGEWQGMPVKAADYWYYDESRDSEGRVKRSYRRFSILVADLPFGVPVVTIEPETFLTRLADGIGFRDIEFESDDFNRRFQVKAEDREFAFKLVDARMMRWLLDAGGGFGFEVLGAWLLVHSGRLGVEELPALFQAAEQFREHVPRLVWNEYGIEPQERTERSGA